jgi:hypothetical protein
LSKICQFQGVHLGIPRFVMQVSANPGPRGYVEGRSRFS